MGQIPSQQVDDPVADEPVAPVESPHAAQPDFGDFLAAPSLLERTTSVPTYDDRHKSGPEYSGGLPYQNISKPNMNAEFTATHDQATATDTSGLAYCIYDFSNLDGYDAEEGMQLFFEKEPEDFSTLWLGMSNWGEDAWDWFFVPASGYVETPGIADYIDPAGRMLAAVVLAAVDTCELERIIVGERLDIRITLNTSLSSDPAQNVAPMTVDFDASPTHVIGGEIVSFDFDWESDGTYDVIGNTDGLESHAYTAHGGYQCNVRAHDDIGRSEVWGVDFYLVNPANVPPVADLQYTDVGGAAPRTVEFDASGSTDDTEVMWYEWDFDDDGEFEVNFLEGTAYETHIFGNSGSNWVTVRVTDNDYATDTAQVNIPLLNGFYHVTVSSGIQVSSKIAIDNCGVSPNYYPTVVFEDYANHDLKASKATTAFGSAWGAVVDAAPASDNTGYNPCMITGSLGRPIVVYGMKDPINTFTLQANRATNDSFTTWSTPVNIKTDGVLDPQCALTRVEGTIVLAASGGWDMDDRNSVYYYKALNDLGTLWDLGVEVYDEPVPGFINCMAVHAAQSGATQWPVISYGRATSGENPNVWQIISAAAADGSSWAAPISYESLPVGAISFQQLNGNPGVASGIGASHSVLSFMRADAEDGSSWPGTPDVLDSGGKGGWCDMELVNGVPAICYYSLEGSNLWYITATDATGSSWNEPFIVASVGIVGQYCSMITRGGTAPIIVYYDHYPKEVKVAYWL